MGGPGDGKPPAEAGVIVFEWPRDPAAAIHYSRVNFEEQDLAKGEHRREEAIQRISTCQEIVF
jgi:hypothetical protein